jgi:hypothetical protein
VRLARHLILPPGLALLMQMTIKLEHMNDPEDQL